MTKSLAAFLLAAVMALTSLTPQQARAADAEDIAKFVIGALVLYGIADAIDDNNNRKSTARKVNRETEAQRRERLRKARYTLPTGCILTHRQRHGEKRRVFGNQCLRNNFHHYAKLPNRCFRRFDTVRGPRVGWGMRCLRRQGYSWG